MADLAKLANLSKRMKTATPKNVEDRPASSTDNGEEEREETQSAPSQAASTKVMVTLVRWPYT